MAPQSSISCNFLPFPPCKRGKVGRAGSEEGRKEITANGWLWRPLLKIVWIKKTCLEYVGFDICDHSTFLVKMAVQASPLTVKPVTVTVLASPKPVFDIKKCHCKRASLTMTLYHRPNTVTVSGEACTGLPADSDTGYSDILLTVTLFGSKKGSPYTENPGYKWPSAYSDTFWSSQHCHCKREGLYLFLPASA